jgi:4-amino-4-deoxy-L-arabinose transferase-like glycosyltransferase
LDARDFSSSDEIPGDTLALAIVLVFAAAMRFFLNNIINYATPADESTYLAFAKTLVAGGIGHYPDLVRAFLDDSDMWLFPSPIRWSWIGTTSIVSSIAGQATFRLIATVSTWAGVASVVLTWWIGRELFDSPTAIAAATLAATSPLQLALGRRALADEFFCMLVLASLAALIRYVKTKRIGWLIAWILCSTFAFGAKEQYLLIYPVVLLFWWLQTRTIDWKTLLAWALPCFLYFAVFCLLAHDVTSFFKIAYRTTSTIGAEYPEQYQNGPPQRVIVDLLAVAPLVTLAMIAGAGWFAARAREMSRNQRHLFVLLAGFLVLHALLSSKNLRYLVSADGPARLFAATFLCTAVHDRRWVTALIVINCVIELLLFRTIFLAGNVYDPTTSELFRTLKMVPH